jgi:hypothetical protein
VLAYHARLGPGAALSLFVVLGVAALAWAGVGTALTALIPTAESAQPLLAFSYFPVMLLSGAPVLPGRDLAVLAAWAVAGLLASLRLFRWTPQPRGGRGRRGR